MSKKSLSGKPEHDIALFTVDLKQRAEQAERDRAELISMLHKLLGAAENMRHGGNRDALVATYDGWAHETSALLSRLEKDRT